jgi:hypothetical protein
MIGILIFFIFIFEAFVAQEREENAIEVPQKDKRIVLLEIRWFPCSILYG